MGPKIFTVREASALVPKIEGSFKEFDAIRERLRKAKQKIDVLEMLWGEEIQAASNPDNREYKHYVEEIEQARQAFDSATKKLLELEIVLKSVENGLVDFYGVIEGRLVFLCWKRGEASIDYYHHLEDGYAGRKEIAAEYKLE